MSVENREPVGESEEARRGRGCFGTAMIMFGVAVVAVGLLFVLFVANNRIPDFHFATPKMPKPNGWDDFVLAAKQFGKKNHYGPYSDPNGPSSWTRADYDSFMRDNQPALDTIRRGLGKAYRHPPVRKSQDISFPQYAQFRELARTLSGASLNWELRGKSGLAMDYRLDCMELGAMLPRGGAMIAGLVGVAIESIGADSVGRILPRLSPAELEGAAKRLARIRARRATCSEVLRVEGDLIAVSLADFLRSPGQGRVGNPLEWFKEDAFGMGMPKKNTKRGFWDNVSFAFGNKRKMINEIRDYHRAVAKEQDREYTGESKVPLPDSLLGQWILGPDLAVHLHESFARAEAVFALIEVEVALRRYRADHGTFPARLSQLAPAYLKKIPYDPFGGKALRYRSLKNGREFALYSIGADMADDGGVGTQYLGRGNPGDIVLERK